MKLRARIERAVTGYWFPSADQGALLPHVRNISVAAQILGWLLTPLSWLTGLIARRKRQQIMQNKRLRRSNPASGASPVIVVVGNLVAGGAGKTPLTIALATVMAKKLGRDRIGLLCRGVGHARSETGARLATHDSSVEQVGDEAVLLAGATGLPVAVGAKRGDALTTLLDHHPTLSVVISDDGLQHVGLPRDIELVMFDARGAGNGKLLPAGPLREPLDHLRGMDAVIENTGFANPAPSTVSEPASPLALTHANRFESATVVRDIMPIEQWQRQMATANQHPGVGMSASDFAARHAGQSVAALAAIASPASFFAVLHASHIDHNAYPLPDHAMLESTLNQLAESLVLVTEKDAVKCPADPRIYVLRIAAAPSPDLLNWLETTIHGLQTD